MSEEDTQISKNHQDGMLLEIAYNEARKNLGLVDVFHNPFDDRGYCEDSHMGIDNILEYNGIFVGTELKNLGGYVGINWILTHIVDRFNEFELDLSIAVISDMKLLSEFGITILRLLGMKIISVGFKVTENNFNQAVQIIEGRLRAILKIPLSLDLVTTTKKKDIPQNIDSLVVENACNLQPTESKTSEQPDQNSKSHVDTIYDLSKDELKRTRAKFTRLCHKFERFLLETQHEDVVLKHLQARIKGLNDANVGFYKRIPEWIKTCMKSNQYRLHPETEEKMNKNYDYWAYTANWYRKENLIRVYVGHYLDTVLELLHLDKSKYEDVYRCFDLKRTIQNRNPSEYAR